MLATSILGGLMLGAVSSFHCIGMCGPLALALPVQHLAPWRQWLAILLYNLGRVLTYALLGGLLGWAGKQFFMAGIQQWVSIVAGSLVLLFTIQYYFLHHSWQPRIFNGLHNWVRKTMISLLQKRNTAWFLPLGMVNGLLPCGMVYTALAAALSFKHSELSIAFMAGFGAGTLPLMLALGCIGQNLKLSARKLLRQLTPHIMIAMGLLLIVRGMQLGIPYLSPEFSGLGNAAIACP